MESRDLVKIGVENLQFLELALPIRCIYLLGFSEPHGDCDEIV